MYVSAVCILTTIVNILLTFDLSLQYFWPPETIRLLILYLSTSRKPRNYFQYPSTLQLPYSPLGAHIPAYSSKYLDCDRRPAQHMS